MKIIQNIRQYIAKATALVIANKGLSIGIAAFVVFAIIGGLHVYSSSKVENKAVVYEKTLSERLSGEFEKLSAAQKFGIVFSIPVTTVAYKALFRRSSNSNVVYVIEYLKPTRLDAWLFSTASKSIFTLFLVFLSRFVVDEKDEHCVRHVSVTTSERSSEQLRRDQLDQELKKLKIDHTAQKAAQGLVPVAAEQQRRADETKAVELKITKQDACLAALPADVYLNRDILIKNCEFRGTQYSDEALSAYLASEAKTASDKPKADRSTREELLATSYEKNLTTDKYAKAWYDIAYNFCNSIRVIPAGICKQVLVLYAKTSARLVNYFIHVSAFTTTHFYKGAFVTIVVSVLYVFHLPYASNATCFFNGKFWALVSYCNPVVVFIQKIVFPLVIRENLNCYVDGVLVGSKELSRTSVLHPFAKL